MVLRELVIMLLEMVVLQELIQVQVVEVLHTKVEDKLQQEVALVVLE